MEQTYRAKLSATPHPPPQPNHNPPPALPPEPHFNIPPQPPSMTYGGLAQAYYDGPRGAPVPIQLPNIYVNPYPPAPQQHEHVDEQPPRVPPQPLNGPTRRHERRHHDTIKLGSWHVKRPHPLLWLCFALSMLALVLEVPKGSLPTITGRHKALRTREKILEEKLHLLTHLSTFLPPPLSAIIAPEDPHDRRHLTTGHNAITGLNSLEGVYGTMIPSMRFWNTNLGTSLGIGADGAGRWWSVEELGAGASVVRGRSADNGIEKEVWVLRVGEGESEDKTLLNALTHSLLLRDRLQEEVATLRDASPTTSGTALTLKAGGPGQGQRSEEEREEWERVEEQRRKHKAREGEIDEREREVMRRERWVVEEMRKLSDKVHAQATELTLEDRITERLKAYQRQLATLHSEDHGTGLEHEHVDL